jgi:hypothetical protein
LARKNIPGFEPSSSLDYMGIEEKQFSQMQVQEILFLKEIGFLMLF